MAKYERDSQRQKVYDSIKAVNIAVGKPLQTMDEVRAFVAKVQGRATLNRRYGGTLQNIKIGDGRGTRWAHGDRDEIKVPTVQRTTIYVLRSLAYTIAARHRYYYNRRISGSRFSELNNSTLAWTGWEYCAILVDLVRYGLGEKEADALIAEFEKNKVKWKKPRARTLSDEDKKALQERGRNLAAKMKDRKRRLEFIKINPEAKLSDLDTFEEHYWETLYRVWR